MSLLASAQKTKIFDPVKEDQSFKNAKITYKSKNIEGRDVYNQDIYYSGKDYYIHNESTQEGLALAIKLATSPKSELAKNKPNLIFTDHGQIIINWSHKRWNLLFDETNLVSNSFQGVRVFSLKLNSLIKK